MYAALMLLWRIKRIFWVEFFHFAKRMVAVRKCFELGERIISTCNC